jgi:hypothetical protein
VGLFRPEATLYKNVIARRHRPSAYYYIDKIVFLEVYCEIRPLALNQHNIELAWRESGLLLYNPELILLKLKRLSKPLSRPSTASGLPPPLDIIITPVLIIPL